VESHQKEHSSLECTAILFCGFAAKDLPEKEAHEKSCGFLKMSSKFDRLESQIASLQFENSQLKTFLKEAGRGPFTQVSPGWGNTTDSIAVPGQGKKKKKKAASKKIIGSF
jgi:hypothetical protein